MAETDERITNRRWHSPSHHHRICFSPRISVRILAHSSLEENWRRISNPCFTKRQDKNKRKQFQIAALLRKWILILLLKVHKSQRRGELRRNLSRIDLLERMSTVRACSPITMLALLLSLEEDKELQVLERLWEEVWLLTLGEEALVAVRIDHKRHLPLLLLQHPHHLQRRHNPRRQLRRRMPNNKQVSFVQTQDRHRHRMVSLHNEVKVGAMIDVRKVLWKEQQRAALLLQGNEW